MTTPGWLRTARSIDRVWDRSDSLRRGYWVMVWSASASATGLLGFSDRRLVAPAFDVVRMTGGRWTWGALFAVAALALLVARVRSAHWLSVTLFSAATLYLLWGMSFLESALNSPAASPLGFVVQTTVAAFHVSHAMAYVGVAPVPRPLSGGAG